MPCYHLIALFYIILSEFSVVHACNFFGGPQEFVHKTPFLLRFLNGAMKKKNLITFQLNPGWLIGILI